MRPALNKEISPADFRNYYWLKEELQTFCRANGLSTAGSKPDIADRIEVFLAAGQIIAPLIKNKRREKEGTLSLDTVITADHICSQEAHAFFKSVIGPSFHFSTFIQIYFKSHIGKTYQDAVDAWYEEEERRKFRVSRKIAPPFKYNQFIRDYFSDPANRGKSRLDGVQAWNMAKSQPGSQQNRCIYFPPKKSHTYR
ncbi:DUF6434 domain-containing protein [Peribacillus sp. SCS-37]|uniref:DUF6434 domain-containing protein n=1 Tax=Paraperibacillus esterisolvens TaxID=3115296 RepID=UPI0039065267